MKHVFKKFAALTSAFAMAATSSASTAFAAADNGLSAEVIATAVNKPTLTLTKEVITLEEAKENPQRTVQVNVSGADAAYASTGLHIYFDSRFDIVVDDFADLPSVTGGKAIKYLNSGCPEFDPTASEQGMKGIFLSTASPANRGLDGNMWNIALRLPSSVKAGDVYPLDIVYKSNPAAEDLFMDADKTMNGMKMQAWTFTQGIFNSETNYNFKANKADIARCKALADIDKSFDGYIAIEDEAQLTNFPKPVLTLATIVMDMEEIPKDRLVTVPLSVSGADLQYASTFLHVYFDKRLECPANKSGNPTVKTGYALDELAVFTPSYDPTAFEKNMNGLLFATAGDIDGGQDGVMYHITFRIPEDAQPGDVYPLDIISNRDPNLPDMFQKTTNDAVSKAMSEWVFSYGIFNDTTNNNFTAPAKDVAKCKALANIDKSFDGYIAIRDTAPTTTTTTKPTTTTTTTTTKKTATTTTTKKTSTTTTTKKPAATTTTTMPVPIPSEMKIIPENVQMAVGDTNKLALLGAENSSDVIWNSDNTAVAEMAADGTVTAKSPGTATIYAVYKGKQTTCIITVINKTSVKLYGDVNGDSSLTVADATLLLQHLGNGDKYKLSAAAKIAADVDGTPGLSAMDALVILQVDAGIYKKEQLPLKYN